MFIRPRMEYGLALNLLRDPIVNKLQLIQNRALRRICGAPSTASINAMQRLLTIEPMKTRNIILNAQFTGKLKNSRDPTIPATKLFNSLLETQGRLKVQKNPLWAKCKLRNAITTPYLQTGEPQTLRMAPLTIVDKHEFVLKTIQNLKGDRKSVV